jgi:hypothetical protein
VSRISSYGAGLVEQKSLSRNDDALSPFIAKISVVDDFVVSFFRLVMKALWDGGRCHQSGSREKGPLKGWDEFIRS